MTDNEIIKALECCNANGGCTDCPLFEIKGRNCIVQLDIYAFDLIKRQQTEIKQLQIALFKQEETIQLISKEKQEYFVKSLAAKSEAITEFAERLKTTFKQMEYTANIKRKTVTVDELICQANWIIREASIDVIDELLSEMTEGDNGA